MQERCIHTDMGKDHRLGSRAEYCPHSDSILVRVLNIRSHNAAGGVQSVVIWEFGGIEVR